MSDHPQHGDEGAEGYDQGYNVPDHPTTEFPPYPQPGEPLSMGYGVAETQSFGPPDGVDLESRSFGGFRSERRFGEPSETYPPAPGPEPGPRAWTAAPAPGFSYPMDNPPAAYYGAPPDPYAEAPYRQSAPPSPYSDLTTSALLRQVKPPPSGGWRRLLYQLSGHLINVGESPRTVRYNDLVVQTNRPLQECHRIALLSLKGGVGKTAITATLGATFASIRGDRVVAVDANPDRGTLSQKVPLETPATVRHLLRDADGIQRYSDVRSYTNQGPSRLEVLASESDPAVSEAFSADDYTRTLQVLERFYSLVLTDCGTGLMHSAMSAVLAKADTLIVVSSGSVDGARSASATLDWLDAHGYEDQVKQSIAVINAVRPRSGKVDMQKVVDHFARRCRAVRLVPFDPHLEEGAEIDLNRLKRETREALIELAAVVAEGFPGNERSHQQFL